MQIQASLSSLVSKSLTLSLAKKELYLKIIPYLSNTAQMALVTILQNEIKKAEYCTEEANAKLLSINQHAVQEMDTLILSELKNAQAEEESAEKSEADNLIRQLNNL